jgi:4-diphosphocytidyl-2C-methyl-D-erythritol kinase
MPAGAEKSSTAAVYEAFDGAEGFERRRAALREALAAGDLALLPPNDLVSSPLADDLRELGAFRADVTGAGPCVYGLFRERAQAEAARRSTAGAGETWLTVPRWYG